MTEGYKPCPICGSTIPDEPTEIDALRLQIAGLQAAIEATQTGLSPAVVEAVARTAERGQTIGLPRPMQPIPPQIPDESTHLARRAVACKGWRWMPGMRWWTDDDHGRLDDWQPEHMGHPPDALPDLSDPATLGCLVALVREAWNQPLIVLIPLTKQRWGLAIPPPLREGPKFKSDTEAESLVIALESAP